MMSEKEEKNFIKAGLVLIGVMVFYVIVSPENKVDKIGEILAVITGLTGVMFALMAVKNQHKRLRGVPRGLGRKNE